MTVNSELEKAKQHLQEININHVWMSLGNTISALQKASKQDKEDIGLNLKVMLEALERHRDSLSNVERYVKAMIDLLDIELED